MLSSVTCRIDTSHPSELWQCIERKSGGGLVGHEVFIPFLGLCLPPVLHLSNCLQFSIHRTRVSWKCEKGWGLSLFFSIILISNTHTHKSSPLIAPHPPSTQPYPCYLLPHPSHLLLLNNRCRYNIKRGVCTRRLLSSSITWRRENI